MINRAVHLLHSFAKQNRRIDSIPVQIDWFCSEFLHALPASSLVPGPLPALNFKEISQASLLGIIDDVLRNAQCSLEFLRGSNNKECSIERISYYKQL